jgi:hypothetical protein
MRLLYNRVGLLAFGKFGRSVKGVGKGDACIFMAQHFARK